MKFLNTAQSRVMSRVRGRLHEHGFDSHLRQVSEGPALLSLRGHGQTATFVVEEGFSEARRKDLSAAAWHGLRGSSPETLLRMRTSIDVAGTLLIDDRIQDQDALALWQADISYADAQGNASISFPGLRFESSAPPPSEKQSPSQARVLSGLSAAFSVSGLPVSLMIMTNPGLLTGTLREIEQTVPTSLGKIQQVIKGLTEQGVVITGDRGRILEGRRLLQGWTENYLSRRDRWHSGQRYESWVDDPVAVVRELSAAGHPVWIGGERAAELMGLPIRAADTLIYVAEARSEVIKSLRLRRSDEGPIEIAKPLWRPRAFEGHLAPSVLVRADLLAAGEPRQVETAERMVADVEVIRRLWAR